MQHTTAGTPPPRASSAPSPLPGIALYTCAMALFPVMDAAAKILSADLSPFQITLLRFLVQTAFVALIIRTLGRPLFGGMSAAIVAKLAAAGALTGAGTAFFFWGLVYLPLANALAIFFVQPILVTLLSAAVFGERVGRHRLGAVAAGLIGTLIVIRPSVANFGLAAILPAFSATCSAVMIMIVRSVTAKVDGIRVQFISGLFGGILIGAIVAVGSAADLAVVEWRPVELAVLPMVLLVATVATTCSFLIVQAIKITSPGVLAPFQYLEIFAATALGYVVFNDFPDALTIVGTAIILCAGFYVFHREHRNARLAITADPGTTAVPDREQEPA